MTRAERWLFIVGWVFVVVFTGFCVAGMMRIVVNDRPREIVAPDDIQRQQLREFIAKFGEDDNLCLALFESEDIIGRDGLRAMRRFAREAVDIDGVVSVFSPLDFVADDIPPGEASEKLADHPLVIGHTVTAEHDAAVVGIRIEPTLQDPDEFRSIVQAVRQLGEQIETDSGGLKIRLTGVPTIREELFRLLRSEPLKFLAISSIVCALVAWYLFRRLAALVVFAIPPQIGVIWALGTLGWMGMEINILNTVLPTLILVIGATDAVHLVFDIRRNLSSGLSPHQAAKLAVAHLAPACGLTSLTTAIGFGSLVVAQSTLIRDFGLSCALGTVLMLAAVLLIVPLAAATPLGRFMAARPQQSAGGTTQRHRAMEILSEFVLAHPRRIIVVGMVLTIGLGALALRLQPDNRLTEAIPPDYDSAAALRTIDERFGGSLFVYVMVEWDEAADADELHEVLAAAHSAVDNDAHLNRPLSVLSVRDYLQQASPQQAIHLASMASTAPVQLHRPADRTTLIIARIGDIGAASAVPVYADFREQLREIEKEHPAFSLTLTGTAVTASYVVNRMIADLGFSLLLAGVVIFVVMTIALRSLRLGLLSVIPNILPIGGVAGLLVLVGRPLEMSSVIVFTIGLGLAVDDTVHVMMRYRRERMALGDGRIEAVRRSIIHVGEALITTTIILLIGFGIVTFSELPSVTLFAQLICFVLIVALVGDLILLPAMLVVFGRKPATQAASREVG